MTPDLLLKSLCVSVYADVHVSFSKRTKKTGKVLSVVLKLETFLDAFEYESMIVANN